MTLVDLLSIGRDITVTGLLLVAVWGSFRGWWVPGWLYRQARSDATLLRDERDAARQELKEIMGFASRATRVAEHVVDGSQRTDRLTAEREVRARRHQAVDPDGK